MKATEALMPASDRDSGNRSQMVDLFNNFYFLKFSAQIDHHVRKPEAA